ncbi:hypothetical protein XH86_35320 [Bradyrhizobium guangdongense]|uniref:Uncharacterized protein n=1 Tax=Bradyrhizobium guangdongense TaxID=1325090 RepID=A0ABX6UPV0_9BRAD|nr:hypothetical protein X265_35280 [Bradyrhizobium guangdongense]QOZ63416.1 hypothetical protein XH86_35320 [Bradyrhizobium guangdongense]
MGDFQGKWGGHVLSAPSLRAQRSNPESLNGDSLDCFVARAPRNDAWRELGSKSRKMGDEHVRFWAVEGRLRDVLTPSGHTCTISTRSANRRRASSPRGNP